MLDARAVLAAAVAVVQSLKKCSLAEATKTVEDAWKAIPSEYTSPWPLTPSGEAHKELAQQLQTENNLPANGKKDAPGQQPLPGTTELVVAKRGKPNKEDLVVAVPKASVAAPAASKQTTAADDWTPAPSPVSVAPVTAPPPPPPPPEIRAPAPWAQKDCTACSGTGYNTKGEPCPICQHKAKASAPATGAESATTTQSSPKPPTGSLKLKPKGDSVARLPVQVLYTDMQCEVCESDQIVFTVPQVEGPAKASFTCQKCNLVGSVDLDAETVATIKKDGTLLATQLTVAGDGSVEAAEKKSRKKAEPVARLPIQAPPAEKTPAAPASAPDIKKLVDGVVGYEAAPINCDATRNELSQVVGAWPKDRVVKKWEETTGKVWKEDLISYDGMRGEIVKALLGKVGVE